MRDIREACGFSQSTSYKFHQMLASLRKKTGIRDAQNVAECRAYLEKMRAIPEPPPLTEKQRKLLLWVSEQRPILYVTPRMECSEAEAKEQTEAALHVIGIFSPDEKTRRMQCRAFFAHYGHPLARVENLSAKHWQILNVIAQGGHAGHLGHSPANARALSREACQRAGVTCPGRLAQRNLVRAFLAACERENAPAASAQAEPPISMDDPAFN